MSDPKFESYKVEETKRLFGPICSRIQEVRNAAIADVEKTIDGWLCGYESPSKMKSIGRLRFPGRSVFREVYEVEMEEGSGDLVMKDAKRNDNMSSVRLHLPGVLQRSLNCPLEDVRIRLCKLLQNLKDRGVCVPQPTVSGPSCFIPFSFLGTLNEDTHIAFVDAFLTNTRLDHVTQVMGFHPLYLDVFLRTQNFILRGDGPLPFDYRHFIAIMAAGRHKCSYLINLQKQEFLLQGGESNWLKGLTAIPQKLRDLYDINKILAHRPWLMNKSHIEKLTKGTESWSLAEVIHAIVILTHFHALSSFVFGCGVNEDLDQEGGYEYESESGASATPKSSPRVKATVWRTPTLERGRHWTKFGLRVSPGEAEVDLETLMERMKTLSRRSEECSQEEAAKSFEHFESELDLSAADLELTNPNFSADIEHFVEDPSFLYQDFAKRGNHDIPTFRIQDYSWDDHGFSLVNELYNDVGSLLDEKFKTAYNLTYYTMGGRKDVDTSRFRMAVWNYIQCMFGIRHDDYDYNEVNQLLERSLKAFIKSTCCYPECVTKKDYDRVLMEFEHSEKVHVNLMILEARMQAELLHALRAVMIYMT